MSGMLAGAAVVPFEIEKKLRARHKLLGDHAILMVDFNQGLTVAQALPRGHMFDAEGGVHWLEYVDWADPVLEEPLRIEKGYAMPSLRPGLGMRWNEQAVQKYLV